MLIVKLIYKVLNLSSSFGDFFLDSALDFRDLFCSCCPYLPVPVDSSDHFLIICESAPQLIRPVHECLHFFLIAAIRIQQPLVCLLSIVAPCTTQIIKRALTLSNEML